MRERQLATGAAHAKPLTHIGALCRHIRASRGVDAAALVRWCGVRHESNITRNFEERGMTSDTTFDRYVQALQSRHLVEPPLMDRQASILRGLWHGRKDLKQLQRGLAAISFENILPRRRSASAAELIAELEQVGRPAFIMDDLWFIHALNGALLRLFNVDPHRSEFLCRWDGWHVVASKFRADSPIRQAYTAPDLFLPPTIVAFLEDERTYPLLFTLQMRKLVERTIAMSEAHGCEFHRWWRQATAFYLPYSLSSLERGIRYQDRPIQVAPRIHTTRSVALGGEYYARYALAVWDPIGNDAHEVFDALRAYEDSARIIYAADYDRDRAFHVNDWPEVRGELDAWMQA